MPCFWWMFALHYTGNTSNVLPLLCRWRPDSSPRHCFAFRRFVRLMAGKSVTCHVTCVSMQRSLLTTKASMTLATSVGIISSVSDKSTGGHGCSAVDHMGAYCVLASAGNMWTSSEMSQAWIVHGTEWEPDSVQCSQWICYRHWYLSHVQFNGSSAGSILILMVTGFQNAFREMPQNAAPSSHCTAGSPLQIPTPLPKLGLEAVQKLSFAKNLSPYSIHRKKSVSRGPTLNSHVYEGRASGWGSWSNTRK